MTHHGPARWSGTDTGKRSVQARDTRAHTVAAPEPAPVVEESAVVEPAVAEPLPTAPEPEAPVQRDATDAAKALAARHNIDLATIPGEGRITKDDVAALIPADDTPDQSDTG